MIEKYFEYYGIIDEGNIVDDEDLEGEDCEVPEKWEEDHGDK